MRYVHSTEICEKCVNKRNMWQSRIRVKTDMPNCIPQYLYHYAHGSFDHNCLLVPVRITMSDSLTVIFCHQWEIFDIFMVLKFYKMPRASSVNACVCCSKVAVCIELITASLCHLYGIIDWLISMSVASGWCNGSRNVAGDCRGDQPQIRSHGIRKCKVGLSVIQFIVVLLK